jgi:hypothetical protein
MNLEEADIIQRLEMPQGDISSRQIEMLLYSRQTPWTIPEGVTVLIQYTKPDGTRGGYDTLPNGELAWSIEENTLTIALAPQVLMVPGEVKLYAGLYLEEMVLQTFAVEIFVKAPFGGKRAGKSEDYFQVTNVLRGPVMAQNGNILAVGAVDAYGRVTQVEALDATTLVNEKGSALLYKKQTLTDNQKIQARANIGAANETAVEWLMAKFVAQGIVLEDDKTNEKYVLFVRNGKLMMEKRGG